MYELIPQKPKPKRDWFPFVMSFLALLLLSAAGIIFLILLPQTMQSTKQLQGGLALMPTPTPDCRGEIATYRQETLAPIMLEWEDAFDLASSSSRISLAPSIAMLQEINRRAKKLEPPPCAMPTHLFFIEATDETINGFLAFMASKPDSEVEAHFDSAATLFEILAAAGKSPPPLNPTATSLAIIRTAWIEARDTCPQSSEYEVLVVPGANLWTGNGQTKTPSGKNIRHATLVNVISESREWTRIEQHGVTGYVQSFFIVDYDPEKDFQPATGDRYEMLCN